MVNSEEYDVKYYVDASIRLVKKILEDMFEANMRTPIYISSKIYIARALRNLENLLVILSKLENKVK
ncbi:MAG TPA: hypothetical protein EYH40_02135 [Desulfurococcales archaeon]|nr:hypothetical protein [Desulfurococcales archaeon]